MKKNRKKLILLLSIVSIGMLLFKTELIAMFYLDNKVELRTSTLNLTHFESESIARQVLNEIKPIDDKIHIHNFEIKFNSDGEITDLYIDFLYKKKILNETRLLTSRIILSNKNLYLLNSFDDNVPFYLKSQVTFSFTEGLVGLKKIPWNEFFTKLSTENPNYYLINFVSSANTSEFFNDDENIKRYSITKFGINEFSKPIADGVDSIQYSITPMFLTGTGSYEGRERLNFYVDYSLLK